jgi:hypothetical protein
MVSLSAGLVACAGTVRVADSDGQTATRQFTIRIMP